MGGANSPREIYIKPNELHFYPGVTMEAFYGSGGSKEPTQDKASWKKIEKILDIGGQNV